MILKYQRIIIPLLIVLTACNLKTEKEPKNNNLSFDKILLSDLDGNPINPGQYKGKAVLLNVWATWCRPCLRELPGLQNAKNMLRNENIVFLLASEEDPGLLTAFAAANKYDFEYVKMRNSGSIQVEVLPTTFIFDDEGRLGYAGTGFRKWDEPENIERILKIIKQDE